MFSLLNIEHLAIAKVPNNRYIHEFAGATTQSHIKYVFKIDYFVLHLTTPFYSVSLFLPYIAVNIFVCVYVSADAMSRIVFYSGERSAFFRSPKPATVHIYTKIMCNKNKTIFY